MPRSRKGIRISGPARADLSRIAVFTEKQWGKRQKSKYLGHIKRKMLELRDKPGLGTDRKEVGTGLRSCLVGQHIVFYRDRPTSLVVVRVLHQSMDPGRHLPEE